ncbi:tRNA (adenosine(37)-N6)-threonylcarbamoyltransferase complex dimerization subunit type 1 TsaB [Azoarcus indigens]|uniref:tRNA threonylcarbamoyladenosine biosynthesis protein TsaB n=1 Tax=Azoarcus indigens TaxID=29545 RepID=A0A4R6EC36_9RHOO|nr:tRNA (adenosine(37)-N6)-threonylcarbamoyltransferase complex dimerization subunit type 1 TsaB [Azoarcus indigens]NMG64099.1 tRNA (adenosine(37)-N6)-threonylcarbamoyltransferase complex dimerization subunit type 1 TsaB [Azoarcus indigens]TDN55695.1 tRNA threonylcarbamoyladenosine biosynthesis protein TsaB [Azoarcus indigens]
MNVLSLETSCEQASIALLCGQDVRSVSLEGHSNHSERILQSIASLLADAGIRARDLSAVAFGCGPGAFTGLRLACGVAQGIALGAGIGVLPIDSLAALALQGGEGKVLAATDARMEEVYFAGFQVRGSRVSPLFEARCVPAAALELMEGEWLGIGSAFRAYPDVLQGRLGERFRGIDADKVPRAEEVARLAAPRVLGGECVSPEEAALLYVRDKVAYTTAERLARGGKA